ncbi:beta-N-acetylhexosaminidase [Lacticaseibacillus kribbianus]|uniref:beta-N-acetylhexosaminidase n=1 Tax=Lacticaseibacillus kribbianus TaxID=2926292 RepID=UPI00214F6BAB|nr:beta-N-acetylhexosaminidase [Lacticaseibacillus kribbianus]
MTITFTALPEELKQGVTALIEDCQLGELTEAVEVSVTHADVLVVTRTGATAHIGYPFPAAFFRGLTCLAAAVRAGRDLNLTEHPQFATTGIMIDMSRNAALSVAGLRRLIRLSARLGLNSALLYMEDVYAVPEYPFWGYQRGRLSEAELRAADAYAQALGVELIPCIQTLGHLKNPMRWGFMNPIRDTDGILLVGEEKTYAFLENIIKAAAAPFATRKIHIGMDEAHELGRGRYLDRNGLVDRTQIMLDHVQRVTAITAALGLEPIMWSDMWFNAAGFGYGDPETVFPDAVKAQIPGVGLMYWDYYNDSRQNYEDVFRVHQTLGQPVSFATGVWTWNGIAPNYGKTMTTMKAGMDAAKNVGLDTVYATMWGDDGGETQFTAGALGLEYFAAQCYRRTAPSQAELAEQFWCHQGKIAADYWLLDRFDQLPDLVLGNPDATNPSKIVLDEDVMHPLFAANLAPHDLRGHYRKLARALAAVVPQADDQAVFDFYRALADTLVAKLSFMEKINSSYFSGQPGDQIGIVNLSQELVKSLNNLRDKHRTVWFELNAPFGWEVLDIRYGGLIARCDTAA